MSSTGVKKQKDLKQYTILRFILFTFYNPQW